MSLTTRFGPDPTVDTELATKAYVDGLASTAKFIIFTHIGLSSGNSLIFVPFGANSGNVNSATEGEAVSRVKSALVLVRHNIQVSTNTKNGVTRVTCRDDTANIVGTDFTITASTTGEFDSGVLTSAIAADSLICTERDTSVPSSGSIEGEITTEFEFS